MVTRRRCPDYSEALFVCLGWLTTMKPLRQSMRSQENGYIQMQFVNATRPRQICFANCMRSGRQTAGKTMKTNAQRDARSRRRIIRSKVDLQRRTPAFAKSEGLLRVRLQPGPYQAFPPPIGHSIRDVECCLILRFARCLPISARPSRATARAASGARSDRRYRSRRPAQPVAGRVSRASRQVSSAWT